MDSMLADAAVTAATSQPMTPMERADAFLAAAQSAAADGLTWVEFGGLLIGLMRTLVAAFDDVSNMAGDVKKAFVLQSVGQLFDALASKAVPLAAWPIWVLCRPAIRALVLALASGGIEQVLKLVRG